MAVELRNCPRNDLLYPLFMALHFKKCLDLAQGQVLPIAQSNKLIEGAEQLVGISKNLPLVQAFADARHNLGKKVQGVDVLQNIGLTVGDKNHVELVKWLIDIANVVLLHGSVLLARIRELWERGE